MKHTQRLALLALSLVVFAPQAIHAAVITVSITDDAFTQKAITINPGDTVLWKNNGSMQHTVTADNNSFGSGTLAPGGSFSQTFSAAGYYPYYCAFHGAAGGVGMSGSITVVASTTQTSTQTSSTVTTSTNTSTSVSNTSVTQLTAQVQALILKLQALQAARAAGTGSVSTSASCPLVGTTLKNGSSGPEVSRLQAYLALDPSVYPDGTVSGYYGSLTEAAIKRWQAKYGIVSYGDAASTGFGVFGPRTAAAIALQCAGALGATGASGSTSISNISGNGAAAIAPSSTVGGFIKVTPVTGEAPLDVVVDATINTVKSCTIAPYAIDWGDGTPATPVQPDPHGNDNGCDSYEQSFSHGYGDPGTYVITLSSGTHEAKASIRVTSAMQQ